MLNFFKLRENYFSTYIIISMAIGFFFIIFQLATTFTEKFGNKEYERQTQKLEYVLEKDGKKVSKAYELTVYFNEEGEVYRTDLAEDGVVIK